MITLEIKVPDKDAQRYKFLFESIAKRRLREEDFEDFFLGLKIDENVGTSKEKYISSNDFLTRLG